MDDTKRFRNLKNDGLHCDICEAVLVGSVVTWEDAREAYGERGVDLFGWLDSIVVHMTYTERGDKHIISLRKAETLGIRHYAH